MLRSGLAGPTLKKIYVCIKHRATSFMGQSSVAKRMNTSLTIKKNLYYDHNFGHIKWTVFSDYIVALETYSVRIHF